MSVYAVLVKDALDILSLLIGPDRTGLEALNIIISHTSQRVTVAHFLALRIVSSAWDSGPTLVM